MKLIYSKPSKNIKKGKKKYLKKMILSRVSRMSCQIYIAENMQGNFSKITNNHIGLKVQLPEETVANIERQIGSQKSKN